MKKQDNFFEVYSNLRKQAVQELIAENSNNKKLLAKLEKYSKRIAN